MEIGEEHAADLTIVDLNGRVDSSSAGALAEKLASLIEARRRQLVVNLDRVDYISSAGFRVLLVASRLAEAAEGKLALCGLSPDLQKLFSLASFTELFEIHATRPPGPAS
jgi:anti-sigma B factor antagonist